MADPVQIPNDPDRAPGLDDTVVDRPGQPSSGTAPSTPVAAPDHPRYRFDGLLGRGSSAHVFDARDLVFDRPVAVKVLGNLGDGSVARFIREARITALLDHPNVITVYDLDFDERGRSILVMRRVEGRSFGEALRQRDSGAEVPGVTTINDLLEIVIKVCDALSRAHARGVCHQDVKPDNILLGSDGEVMLVDWGEASISGEDAAVRGGTPIGTPMYMSPEQARGESAGPTSDIYGLGAVLFHAVVGRPPLRPGEFARFMERRSRGEYDPPDAQEQAAIPRPLLSIILKTIAATPAQRYLTVAELRSDLRNFQGGLAVTAFREGPLARAVRWIRRRRSAILAGAAILVMAGTIVWLVVGERLKERAVWGGAFITERFAGGWHQEWNELVPGSFSVRNGWLVSEAPNDAYLTCSRILTPPVAVEYQGRIMPGQIPCDLSLIWTSATSAAIADPSRQPGIAVKFGAFQNSNMAICRMPDQARLAQRPLTLDVDRIYRMRIEFEDDRITAFLDGEQVMTCREFLPIGPGRVSLQAWYPGKAFSDVRIYRKEVPEKTSILTVGDSSMRHGDFARAAEDYALVLGSAVSPAVTEQARYRHGLALWSLGRQRPAEVEWAQLEDPRLIGQAACLRLAWTADHGSGDGFAAEFAYRWEASPDLRQQLLQVWERAAMRAAIADDRLAGSMIGQLLSVRERCFPDDTQTVFEDAALRIRLGSDPGIFAKSIEQSASSVFARIAVGRISEAYRHPGARTWELAKCCWHLGRLTEVLDIPATRVIHRQMSLIKLGRLDEAKDAGPKVNWLLASGMAEEALREAERGQLEYIAALIQLGRLDAAIDEPLVDGAVCTWARGVAQILAGREEDAVFYGANLGIREQARWLRARIAGTPTAADDDRRIAQGVCFSDVHLWRAVCDQGWFIPWFAAPFLDALHGDRAAMAAAMERIPREHADQFAQRPVHLAGLINGTMDREAFLRQPVHSEAEAWLQVGMGMRAELQGDAKAALAAYRAFTALPMHRRLLIGLLPDPLVERFVAWRLDVLGQRP